VSSSAAGLHALTDLGLNMSLATKEQLIIVLNIASLFYLALEPFASEEHQFLDISLDFLTPVTIKIQLSLKEIWNLPEKRKR
jgi:hypothetical protein